MIDYKLTEAEENLANIIWEKERLSKKEVQELQRLIDDYEGED